MALCSTEHSKSPQEPRECPWRLWRLGSGLHSQTPSTTIASLLGKNSYFFFICFLFQVRFHLSGGSGGGVSTFLNGQRFTVTSTLPKLGICALHDRSAPVKWILLSLPVEGTERDWQVDCQRKKRTEGVRLCSLPSTTPSPCQVLGEQQIPCPPLWAPQAANTHTRKSSNHSRSQGS